jgi:hypothetical protein
LPASTISLSASVPDLALSSLLDAPIKPSPDRYRRGARRADSSTSVSASSGTVTPAQQSPLIGSSTTSGAAKAAIVVPVGAADVQPPPRPGHNRASSVDDMQVPRQGSVDQAKRYRRRSVSTFDSATGVPDAASVNFSSNATSSLVQHPSQEHRPGSSPGRNGSRPSSSQGHERLGSAGSASSAGSTRPSVCAIAVDVSCLC